MAWLLPPLTPHFHAALRDVTAQNPEARVRAAQRFGMADASERDRALTALESLSEDAHPRVRATAVLGLGELASAASLDALQARLDDPDAEVRELAVVAIARLDAPASGSAETARALLREALHHSTPEVRFQAVAALGDLEPERASTALAPLCDDPDDRVRAQLAETLGELPAGDTALLSRLLQDPTEDVRLSAALALAQRDQTASERDLIHALSQRRRTVEVCAALGRVGSDAARAALAQLAERLLAPGHERAAAGAALLHLGDPRGAPALRRVLRGWSPTARNYAVELLGSAHGTALAEDLEQLCRRPRGTDRLTLAQTLEALAAAGADVTAGLEILAGGPRDSAARLAERLLRTR